MRLFRPLPQSDHLVDIGPLGGGGEDGLRLRSVQVAAVDDDLGAAVEGDPHIVEIDPVAGNNQAAIELVQA